MNILVLRTDKLGDFITALPTFYVLKHYNPNNKIIACVAQLNQELALNCPFIDEVVVDDKKSSVFVLAKKLRALDIDASIALFSNTRVALALFLAAIPKRIAPATKIAQIFYTHRITQRRSEVKMAEFEYNLELAKALFPKIDLHYTKPLLALQDTNETYKDYLCFHVGFGGSSDANWTLDEYVVLIDGALQNNKVLLSFGPDEKELMKRMQDKLKGKDVVFYLSEDGLVEFARVIQSFKLFISTSTGTYHLASLVGTPTMTFFADTLFASSKRWRGVGEIAIQNNYEIPHDTIRRKELFDKVLQKLHSL